MKALTVRQPYATLIVSGSKAIENRTRRTALRGLIVIHAGSAIHERFRDDAPLHRLPRACIVGTVQLVDSHLAGAPGCHCTGADGAEFYDDHGREVHHWMLEDARAFVTPIPRVKGMLGFWEPEPTTEYLVETAEVQS